jgi:cytochrome oxidase assembly protein ShyY1
MHLTAFRVSTKLHDIPIHDLTYTATDRESLLLNRGILPLASEREVLPPPPLQVVVVLDKEDSKSVFGMTEKNEKLLLKDWSLIGRALGVPEAESQVAVKVVSDPISSPGADSDSDSDSPRRSPREGPIILHRLSTTDIPNRHLEYILTWYSLALLSTAMGFFKK